MSSRLNARLWVGSLLRRVSQAGDFAAVVKKGDETAGQVILVTRSRNGRTQVFTRTMNSTGDYSWTIAMSKEQEELVKINEYLERQARYDPDLWIIELDTDNPERFVDDELI